MSHRHSCDRCRQQKVRCLRDDSQGASSSTTSLARCERCTKAAVDCVYSLRQRSNHSSIKPSTRGDISAEPNNPSTTSWFAQGLGGVFCPRGPGSGPDFADLTGPLLGVDDGGTVPGFGGWDANLQLVSPFSPLNSSTEPSTADEGGRSQEARAVSTGPSTTDDENPADALSAQLTALSARTTQAMRRLVRSGGAPPTVSSPEVNEAFEGANTLIRIINNITTASSDRDEITIDPTTTDYGLVFLALASHQHLMALFRAICDVIYQYLESMVSGDEHQHQQQRGLHHGDVGPSSVAQFVMVLQLLLHLINRMSRSLQANQSVEYGSGSSSGGQVTPITPNTGPSRVEAGVESKAVGQVGLLVLAQSIVGAIPDEHEKLRQVIQELQTKIERLELH
ncbi:hypothetical protein EDB81DRAFT_809013 [Dactylonectria macrodidyma]|uniref:Zn(2)-C6 fungal-type domain-containing protein n=1 Tax=Dactylonectria macrodidyma TaxID=307937 RepID=A0A9P9DX02_9HYPO|nr:hypothetical protein EDB81DRAFT_809013 [Dactylonectria macrodidyma]